MLFAFICLLNGSPIAAQSLEDSVRAALIADDPAQLQSLIAEAQTAALASGDHSEIRFVYRRIFATTHPGYEQSIRHWVATHPDSAFAWAALADMQYWQALAYRASDGYSKSGPKPLGDGFADLLPEAQLSALQAHSLDPAFPRATTVALLTHLHGRPAFGPIAVATETLELVPDTSVVVAAARTTLVQTGGNFGEAYATCANLAAYVQGYSADYCAIEVAMTTGASWQAQTAAHQAVMNDPSPYLDSLRISAVNRMPLGVEDATALIALHNSQLSEVGDIASWLRDAASLAYKYENTFYIDEARQLALVEGRKRIKDDPRNPWLALMLIDNFGFDGSLPPPDSAERLKAIHAGTKALWRAALPFGYQSGAFWHAGVAADIDLHTDETGGAIKALPYIENALILSKHSDWTVSKLFETLVWMAYDSLQVVPGEDRTEFVTRDRPAPSQEVRCAIGRLARMMEFVCTRPTNSFTTLCQEKRPGSEIQDIILKLESPDYCPTVAAMSPSQLPYTALRAVPGFDPATYAGAATAP